MDQDFTALWERHIEASRAEFPKTTGPEPQRHGDEVGRFWDERMESVAEALEELYAAVNPARTGHITTNTPCQAKSTLPGFTQP